jgi:hypothetical protein
MLYLLELLTNPVLAIIISILIILLIREIIMWYWKINRIVSLQESQEELLENIYNELTELNKKNK